MTPTKDDLLDVIDLTEKYITFLLEMIDENELDLVLSASISATIIVLVNKTDAQTASLYGHVFLHTLKNAIQANNFKDSLPS